ncbi:MAG: N-acetylmuramoyl-L-alanine amidase [Planctomycetota bacterium]
MKYFWTLMILGASLLYASTDYGPATWSAADSSNYTTLSSRTIDRVVIHTIEGSAGGAISWFKNPVSNVSAHYVVAYSGAVTQMVREKDKAWHCGSYNYRAIGIEHEGFAGQNRWTETEYAASAALTRSICIKYGIPKTRSYVIGHIEVPGATHTDPGSYFNWDYFMALVNGSTGGSTGGGSTGGGSGTTSADVVSVVASSLNVRSAPWGTILGQVQSGDKFVVRGTSDGFYKINWKGQDAWVSASYTSAIHSGTGMTVTTGSLNVRTGPGTTYSTVGSVFSGQKYVVDSVSSGWKKFQFDADLRWSHGDYVSTFAID